MAGYGVKSLQERLNAIEMIDDDIDEFVIANGTVQIWVKEEFYEKSNPKDTTYGELDALPYIALSKEGILEMAELIKAVEMEELLAGESDE